MEQVNQNLQELDNFDFKKAYLETFNFKTEGSHFIKPHIIEHAIKNIKRADTIFRFMRYVDADIADSLEAGIFEYALIKVAIDDLSVDFVENVYRDKANDILKNIDPTNERVQNKTLLPMLQAKQVDPHYVAFFSCTQLHPARWKEILDRKTQVDKERNNFKVTDIYKCYKCGNRKTKTSQMQTRSADEPMTIFVTCLVCYNTFTK